MREQQPVLDAIDLMVCRCGQWWFGGNEKYCPSGHAYDFTTHRYVPEAENARLREALSRIAYGLEGEMGHYDAPRDNTWWGRIALEALGGDRA